LLNIPVPVGKDRIFEKPGYRYAMTRKEQEKKEKTRNEKNTDFKPLRRYLDTYHVIHWTLT